MMVVFAMMMMSTMTIMPIIMMLFCRIQLPRILQVAVCVSVCLSVCVYVCRFAHTGLVCPEAAATSPHLVLPLASRGVYVLLEIRGARAGGRR